MRLIDADALEKLLTDMATDAKSIRELQLNALCYAAVKSESMTPTIDAVPVVRCAECVYWQKPQIRTPDGMYRDYRPDEVDHLLGCPGVTADIGINVGSYCNGYWVENYVEDGRHEWKGKDDYCSRGERRNDDGKITEVEK